MRVGGGGGGGGGGVAAAGEVDSDDGERGAGELGAETPSVEAGAGEMGRERVDACACMLGWAGAHTGMSGWVHARSRRKSRESAG